jgi:hypothetical protein
MEVAHMNSNERKMSKFRATCKNMAGLSTGMAKFCVASEKADEAGFHAAAAARWAFHGYPELRDTNHRDRVD